LIIGGIVLAKVRRGIMSKDDFVRLVLNEISDDDADRALFSDFL